MIFINEGKPTKIYAKVFKCANKGKYISALLSTSSKEKDGTYKNSSWSSLLFGQDVQEGDRIVITKAKIENVYSKEHNKSFCNLIVFEYHIEEPKTTTTNTMSDAESDLPF